MVRLLCIFTLFVARAISWNGEGHRIVARVASSLIRPKTSRYVRDVLRSTEPESASRNPKRLMTSVANWADVVSDSSEWSGELHFAHTPVRACAPFDKVRDCGFDGSGRCIVTAISNYTMRAGDYDLDAGERAEAIKFLIHFVADMHQPLHLGFADDFGGTRISLTQPEGLSLHETWDVALIERAKALRGDSWYSAALSMVGDLDDSKQREALEYRISEFHDEDEVEIWASRVVSETIMAHTCESAYKNELKAWIESGTALSVAYMSQRAAIVDELLIKASVRLAHVLDTVADRYFAGERKAEGAALLAEMASKSAFKISKNPFESLYMEFSLDVEDAVFEVDVSEEESEEDYTSEMEVEVSTTRRPKSTKPVATTTTLSPEERKREQNRKKRLKAKISKRKIFGVDVESLVLIKRGRKFYITDSKFVTSDSFVPSSFMIVNVKFAGHSATDAPIPFLFDLGVFSDDHRPEPELVRAVFKKIGGMDYSAEAAATTTSPDSLVVATTAIPGEFAVESFSVVGTPKEEAMKTQKRVQVKANSWNPMMALFGLPPTEYSSADELSVKDMLRKRPTNKALRIKYGGELPSDEVRVRDLILAMSADLVFINLGKITVLSTKEYLVDRTNMRYVFNRVATINSKVSMTKSTFLYVDTRMLDDTLMPSHFALIDGIMGRRSNRDIAREVLRLGSPILDRLKVLGDSLEQGMILGGESMLQSVVAFSAIRTIDRKSSSYDTIEYIIRDPAEETRLCAKLGIPAIHKLRPEEFGLQSPSQLVASRRKPS